MPISVVTRTKSFLLSQRKYSGRRPGFARGDSSPKSSRSKTIQDIAANQQATITNAKNISANQQATAANAADIQKNIADIEANTKRFNDLTDYDVKGDLTVNFKVGSYKVSADDQAKLKQLAQSTSGLKGYIVEGKEGLYRLDRRRRHEHNPEPRTERKQ